LNGEIPLTKEVNMISKLFLLAFLLTLTLSAQERVLLHIGRDGKQEAIPLRKGERAQDVIARRENAKTAITNSADKASGLVDTLRNYPNESSLTTNFGWTHQDVAFQWYTSQASGRVKEFWWRNHLLQGNVKKATIRAWYADPRLATRPGIVLTKFMGAYKDPSDGDGMVTPFKPATGDQWFYGSTEADSSNWNFSPLLSEAPKWLPGGLQVNLDSSVWQGIKLEEWGDSMFVNLGQMFGFTISNDTKISEIPVGGTDERMEILSYANQNPAPYHSFKFYEQGRTGTTDKGWHLRGDYEWGMYVVIEYTSGCSPRIIPSTLSTTLSTLPRKVCVTVHGCDSTQSVKLFYKKGSLSQYDSVSILGDLVNYCFEQPGGNPGDTIYWYLAITDVRGNRTALSPRNYKIFKKTQDRLFIYNNAQYNLSTGSLIYTGSSKSYDRWSVPNDGVGELDTLLSLYNNVLIADGSFPSRDVYRPLIKWFAGASALNKKNLFFTSQDYGCFVNGTCADTITASGSFEKEILGIATLGPQDQGPTNRPVKLIPQSDVVTDYLLKYNADSSTTLWHYPTFELAFSAYPDFIQPTPSAKVLFKDGTGNNAFGIKNSGTGFNTMFLAFDAGALQFRSDTSLHNSSYTQVTDPKYQWIVDVKSLSNSFFDAVTGVDGSNVQTPQSFSLSQNYPNPFNPATVIEYTLGERTNIQLTIYNVLGQKVASLVNEVQDAGIHSAQFNGQHLASGLYFYEMRAGSFVGSRKMLLLK
jgi:hypothetical protein